MHKTCFKTLRMCDHDSYIWWDEGTDPELESVVYLLLDEVTASEGLQFLDQLITQEVMSYTIIDEVNESIAETMCDLVVDSSCDTVIEQVLDMDLEELSAYVLRLSASSEYTKNHRTTYENTNTLSDKLNGETKNLAIVPSTENREGVRAGPVIYSLPCSEDTSPETADRINEAQFEFLDGDELQAAALELITSRSEAFNTREETFDLTDTPLGSFLAKGENFIETEGEHYIGHTVEADIALQTKDRSYWGAFLAAVWNAWHEPMHRLRARARKQLRYVLLHKIDGDDEDQKSSIESHMGSARHLGPKALQQYHTWPLSETQKAEVNEFYAASNALTKGDSDGIDFFVSQSWSEHDDASLTLRWKALCAISDAFQDKYGRPPRFWISSVCICASSREKDLHDHVIMSPVYMSFCKTILALHTPAYLGSLNPYRVGCLWAVADLYFCSMISPSDDPAHRILWFSLFKRNHFPPVVRLSRKPLTIAGSNKQVALSCASQREFDHLLSNLQNCPGGLSAVGCRLAALWRHVFSRGYTEWLALCEACEDPGPVGTAEVETLLARGVSPEFPVAEKQGSKESDMQALSDTSLSMKQVILQQQPLAIAVIAYMKRLKASKGKSNQPHISRDTIYNLLAHGANRLSIFHHPEFGEVCHGDIAATELLNTILRPEFPRLNLLQNGDLDMEATLVLCDLYKVNDDLLSICGISEGEIELDLSNRNLTDTSLMLLSVESMNIKSLNLSNNLHISKTGFCLLGCMTALFELRMQACEGWTGSLRDITAICPNLTILDLSRTRVQGSLENVLAKCKQMEVLDLRLTGVEGSLEFVSGCLKMRYLNLGFTYIEGSLRAVSNLTKLEFLDLSSTQVEGSLELLEHCSRLQTLEIADNTRIAGKIESIAGCSQLKVIALGDTNISGNLEGICRCRELETLSLYRTKINGSFDYIGRCSRITKVDLFECKRLSGTLNGFASCTNLELLNLAYTGANGSLLPLNRCLNLRMLNLDHCTDIDHSTMKELESCVKLQKINLHGCRGIAGPRSESILEYDAPSGTEQSLRFESPLRCLQIFNAYQYILRINMEGCEHITGRLEPLGSCRLLRSLNLNRTSVFGSLAPLSNCKVLTELCLGFTDIEGPLGPLAKCKSLTMLVVCFTKLHGAINPLSACRMLTYIDLRKTRIFGNLDCLSKCTQIKALNLSYTELRGDLSSLNGCSDLVNLNLTFAKGISGIENFVDLQKNIRNKACDVQASQGDSAMDLLLDKVSPTKPSTIPASKLLHGSPVRSRRWKKPGNKWSQQQGRMSP